MSIFFLGLKPVKCLCSLEIFLVLVYFFKHREVNYYVKDKYINQNDMINTWNKMCKPLNQNLKEKNIFDVIYWPIIVTLLAY